MKRYVVVLLVLLTAFGLAACPQNDSKEQRATRNGEENELTTIQVGAVLSLDGQYAEYGAAIKRGMELAQEKINSEGGIAGRQFVISFENSGSTRQGAVSAFNKLISAGKKIVIGAETTDLTEVLIPIAADKEIILISPSATSPALREIKSNGFFFRICPTDDREADQLAAELPRPGKFPYIKRPFLRNLVLVRKNSSYSEGIWRVYGRELGNRQIQYEILRFDNNLLQSKPEENGSFNEQMKSIIGIARDYQMDEEDPTQLGAITIFGFAEDVEMLLRAFKHEGINAQVYTSSSVDTSRFFKDAADVSEGIVFPRVFDPQNEQNPLVLEVVSEYREKYQSEPDLYVAYGYDVAMLVGLTLQRENIIDYISEPANLRLQMNDVHFNGLTGRIDFQQANHEVAKTFAIYKMKEGGKALVIYEYEEQVLIERQRQLERMTR